MLSAHALVRIICADNGGTFRAHSAVDFSPVTFGDGFMVSDYGTESTYRVETFSADALEDYVAAQLDALSNRSAFLGAWVEDDTVYLDVSRHVANRSAAIVRGLNNFQLAVWDCAAGTAIDLYADQALIRD